MTVKMNQMTDDPVDCLRLFDKRYDSHTHSRVKLYWDIKSLTR